MMIWGRPYIFNLSANHFVRVCFGLLLYCWSGSQLFAAAPQELDSKNYCFVPIENAEPKERDVFQAYRVLRLAQTFPTEPDLIVSAQNGGGLWTLSEDLSWQLLASTVRYNSKHTRRLTAHPSGNGVLAVARRQLLWMRVGKEPLVLTTFPKYSDRPVAPITVPEWGMAFFVVGPKLYRIDKQNKLEVLSDSIPVLKKSRVMDYRLGFQANEDKVVLSINSIVFTVDREGKLGDENHVSDPGYIENIRLFRNSGNTNQRWESNDHPFAMFPVSSVEGSEYIYSLSLIRDPIWISSRQVLILPTQNSMFAGIDRRTQLGHHCEILRKAPPASQFLRSQPLPSVGGAIWRKKWGVVSEQSDGSILFLNRKRPFILKKGELSSQRISLPSKFSVKGLRSIVAIPNSKNFVISNDDGVFVFDGDTGITELDFGWFGPAPQRTGSFVPIRSRNAVLRFNDFHYVHAIKSDWRLVRLDGPKWKGQFQEVLEMSSTGEVLVGGSGKVCQLIGLERLQCFQMPGLRRNYRPWVGDRALFELRRNGTAVIGSSDGIYLYRDGKVSKPVDLKLRALSVLDLGPSKPALIGTDRGLFQLTQNGQIQATAYTKRFELGAVRSLSKLSDTDEVLLGTDTGLWKITSDGNLEPIDRSINRMIGIVTKFVDVPWWESKLVQSRLGTLILHNDGRLERLTLSDGGRAWAIPRVFVKAERVFTSTGSMLLQTD